jgi:hypothetical protein
VLARKLVGNLLLMARLDPRSWDYRPPRWLNKVALRVFASTIRHVEPDDAIAMGQKEIVRYERRYGRDNQLTINTMVNVAQLMYGGNRLDEATALYEEALGYLSLRRGPNHERTLSAELLLGLTFLKSGIRVW